MNRKILMLGAVLLPVGALLLSGCGPENATNEPEVALDQASDNWGNLPFLDLTGDWDLAWTEWGHCLDAWDNDGNGLTDMADPFCHVLGPIRDLSLYNYPIGHNFFPVADWDITNGPGADGWFRNPMQISEWLRFLTEPDGNVAGIDVYGPGVNPEVVPLPEPIPGAPLPLGTFHQGNNNNLWIPYDYIGGPYDDIDGPWGVGDVYWDIYDPILSLPGGPGVLYRSQGPWGGNGSQGALMPARTGNPDGI